MARGPWRPGLTTNALHARAAHVVGIDKSEPTIAEARRLVPAASLTGG